MHVERTDEPSWTTLTVDVDDVYDVAEDVLGNISYVMSLGRMSAGSILQRPMDLYVDW